MNTDLFACIYAREFPAQALLRLRPELQRKAVAVVEGECPAEFVCSANRYGYSRGVQYGMTRPQLEVLDQIGVLRRSFPEERSARTALLECVSRFSPLVEQITYDNVLAFGADLKGTEKLFGKPETIANNLRQEAQKISLSVSVAISRNLHTALCWARASEGAKVIPDDEGQEALAPLPIGVLGLTPEQHETFSLWGIHTVGALTALPEVSLIARLGQDGKRLRQLGCGKYPHLLKPIEEELELKEEIEFEAGVESLDSVMFVLSSMLAQLIVRVQSRALALAAVTVICKLEGGNVHRRTIRPAIPTVDHADVLKLLHLDLITNSPPVAVLAVAVTVDTNKPSQAQLGLFSPQLPEPMRLEVTIARLIAVVGSAERVGTPELLDANRRDSFRMGHFTTPENAGSMMPTLRSPFGVCILRPPEHAFVLTHEDRPNQFVFRSQRYQVLEAYGPFNRSGDWWKQERWSYQQWDVVGTSGSKETICCELSYDTQAQTWQVEALYD
jgi:protein ImuB